jgi:DNA-3-methyladenine glycosylase II
MTDHPSWLSTEDGFAYRAVRCGDAVWSLTVTPADGGGRHTDAHRVSGASDTPMPDVIDPAALTGPTAIVASLCTAGTVARWRNPDLWDALATAIVRQVIRAGQACKLYRAFSQAYGESVSTPLGQTWLVPIPEIVLMLSDAEFAQLGMAFKGRPLRAAAEAFLEFGAKWAGLDPAGLVTEVQNVQGVGPWTAGAGVADLINDYTLYPFADLAVRTWAKRLTPQRCWPDTEPEFAQAWARLAGDQLSDWTLLTLAWGVRHASTTGTVAL